MPGRRSKDAAYLETMRRAIETFGNLPHMATALGVSVEDLKMWISGKKAPSYEVFLRALDLVSTHPAVASLSKPPSK